MGQVLVANDSFCTQLNVFHHGKVDLVSNKKMQ